MADLFSVPRVVVAALIVKEGRVLLGLRLGSIAPGTWCFPGGFLEHREGLAGCAYREVKEETGLDVRMQHLLDVDEVYDEDTGIHFIVHFARCMLLSPERDPVVREPDKCVEWGWFAPTELPDPIIPSAVSFFAGGSLLRRGPEFLRELQP